MKTLAFLLSIFATATVLGQYHVNGCKSRKLDGQICIIKNAGKSDRFTSSDLLKLKNYIASHPALPWMQLLDPDKKLLGSLKAGASKIKKSDRKRYEELLAHLIKRMEPEHVVEALALQSGVNYLSSPNKLLMRRFVNVLSAGSHDNMEVSDFNYRHCSPNLKKFNAIMKDRGRCSNLEESKNSFHLYHTLAELAACDAYEIEKIQIQESRRPEEESEEAPCAVKLNDISASVGRGTVEINSGGRVIRVDWRAGHDMSGLKNDIRYWRDQLEPQFIKALGKSPVANTHSTLKED